jgi:N-acetyl-D-muramate 6-phosphate phosphatase
VPLDLQRIQAICFDVDGTLSDTDDVWVDDLAGKLRRFAMIFPRRDPQRLARRIIMASETPGTLVFSMMGRMDLDRQMGFLIDWITRFGPPRKRRIYRLIPDLNSLLPALAQRYPLAVISANTPNNTDAFIDHFELRPYFKCVANARTCSHTKPFPDPIRWAAAQIGVDPSACLMIGDTTVDIHAGRAAGAQTVGVLCGFGEEAELRRAGADLILPRTADLGGLLLDFISWGQPEQSG